MPVSVRLSRENERRLTAMARHTQRTKASCLRQIIEQGLEDMEDYYAAEEVMKKVRSGEMKLYSLEEVEREFGIVDN